MPRPRKQEPTQSSPKLDGFAEQVRSALEHSADAHWLATASPLTSPYLLAHVFPANPTPASEGLENPLIYGQLLQQLLQQAVHQQAEEIQSILNTQFIAPDPHITIIGRAQRLGISERTYYRQLDKAVQAVADTLYTLLSPALRLEQPVASDGIQRTLRHTIMQALAQRQSVYLSGGSGVGKTTLGVSIAQQWGQSAFWYTIRPALNDNLLSLVFALAYFLRGRGAPITWRQLLAEPVAHQLPTLLGLLRYDLEALQTTALLFCIDEIDLLQAEREEHRQMLFLLEELRAYVPCLLLGQRVVMEVERQIVLTGFAADEYSGWLQRAKLASLPALLQQQLWSLTNGNPALLTLIAALQAQGEALDLLLTSFRSAPSLEALFQRLWRRLTEAERMILMQIALFRTGCPVNGLPLARSVVQQLAERALLVTDNAANFSVLSHIQPFVRQRIPSEIRTQLHMNAALLLEAQANCIEALHHYIQARRPERAVWLWFNYRKQETKQGQVVNVLQTLRAIDPADLPLEEDRAVLRLARAELYKQLGQAEEAEAELRANPLPKAHPASLLMQTLLGDVLEQQGRAEHALEQYRSVLTILSGTPLYQQSMVHKKISYLYTARLPDPKQAKQEALTACILADTNYAYLAELAGDFVTAHHHYQSALTFAHSLGEDLHVLSMVYAYLSKLFLKQHDLPAAVEAMERATSYATQRGDTVSPLYTVMNLAYAYCQMGEFEKARQLATDSLATALAMRHSYLIAGLAAAQSHAYYYLGLWGEAEASAQQSLQEEEEFFRAWALSILGLVYAATNRYAAGVNLLQNAVEQAGEGNPYDAAFALKCLAEVHQRAGQKGLAVEAYQKAAFLYERMQLVSEGEEIRQQLALLAEAEPNFSNTGGSS